MEIRKKILIIEDNESIRENTSDFLLLEGFQVIEAKNGAEGIQMALAQVPDLILCDVMMPEMDGYQVFNTLQQVPGTSFIPFIFLTAKSQPDDFRLGMQLGADDYITKPFKLSDLLSSIKKRLEKFDKLTRTNYEQFIALANSPLNGVFLYHNGKFIIVNEKLSELSGYSLKEFQNLDLLAQIPKDEQESARRELQKIASGGVDKLKLHFSWRNKEGNLLNLHGYVRTIIHKGSRAYVGSIVKAPENLYETTNSFFHENPDQIDKLIAMLFDQPDNISDELISMTRNFSYERNKSKKLLEELNLTPREMEVLKLICSGLTNAEIAEKLFISQRTVDGHRGNLLSKTNTKNTASLVAFAFKNRLME